VRLRESTLNDAQKRYVAALVEIQIASVLMHAWAEVEHDLLYKPVQGRLSDDEYAILDELNGLVMTGEIALERLQKAGEARVAAHA
jgi:ppGpp synthetase/RelA/SpoT-type nucleotidyltranferase